jgi:hypothetical protein
VDSLATIAATFEGARERARRRPLAPRREREAMPVHPFHPIIYVRGFAGTQGEVEDTVADPYMGFNIGSTKSRQLWTGEIAKFFFESPMVRLFKEHEYDDVYVEGLDQILDAQATEGIPYRSILIYRYYEQASKTLGTGKLPEMEDYARGLSDLVLKLRDKVCANPKNRVKPKDFRVYLVAHSMGGLICRAFLQNPKLGVAEAKAAVDKFFTYATPHNGIDFQLFGNVPNWLSYHNTSDFNRDRIAEYLGIVPEFAKSKEVGLVKNFDPERVFCLVGTNSRDYSVAGGLSSTLVGDQSDGLVQIANAQTHGPKLDGAQAGEDVWSPSAFVNRSHSGHFGIVNSEEGYQNLTRFLFGNVRVDGVLEIAKLTLPPKVQKAFDAGKTIRASYQFEVIVSVRGKTWQMHRRTVAENCAIFRKYDDLFGDNGKPRLENSPRLFSVFLDGTKRVVPTRRSLGFAVEVRVLVPDYEVDGFLFLNDHYEGGHLFRDRAYVEATPPDSKQKTWAIQYGFESLTPNATTTDAPVTATEDGIEFTIPIVQPTPPGIEATLRVTARRWNQ